VAYNEVWGIKEYEKLKVDKFEIKSSKLRENSRGGGTIIFGKTEIQMKALSTPFIEGIIETTGVKVCGLNFINIYRPPSGDKDTFVDLLTQYLDTLRGQKIILGGDFNLNIIGGNNWLSQICNLYGIECKINEYTRLDSETCIDNYITNTTGEFRVSEVAIADHQAITAVVKLDVKKSKIKQKYTYETR
jgi:hypothetical protein